MAASVVHKEDGIIIRLNNAASVLDAELFAISIVLEKARGTRDKMTIPTDSLTAVKMISHGKLELNTTTRDITDVASRLSQNPTINWIPAHVVIAGNEK